MKGKDERTLRELGLRLHDAPEGPGDWPGSAHALPAHVLLAHGMPAGQPHPVGDGTITIAGETKRFSKKVAKVLTKAASR